MQRRVYFYLLYPFQIKGAVPPPLVWQAILGNNCELICICALFLINSRTSYDATRQLYPHQYCKPKASADIRNVKSGLWVRVGLSLALIDSSQTTAAPSQNLLSQETSLSLAIEAQLRKIRRFLQIAGGAMANKPLSRCNQKSWQVFPTRRNLLIKMSLKIKCETEH